MTVRKFDDWSVHSTIACSFMLHIVPISKSCVLKATARNKFRKVNFNSKRYKGQPQREQIVEMVYAVCPVKYTYQCLLPKIFSHLNNKK